MCTQAALAQPFNWSVVNSDSSQISQDYKQGELIVRFADTNIRQISGPRTTRSLRSDISATIVSGAYVEKEYDQIAPGLALVKLPKGVSVSDAIILFNQSPNILYAQPNYKIWALIVPNDPNFPDQWGLNNTGQTGGLPDADIDAPEAWNITTGSDDVIVAVIDSGIDYNHPDLNANMWINDGEVNTPGVVDVNDFNNVDDDGNGFIDDIYGYDFVDDDGDPMDELFHGTHVAGIIGAIGNNGEGIAGVCWTVKLMALRILDANGVGATSDAIEAINYAMTYRAKVINASWGGYSYSQALYDAIGAVGNAGILFVAAAGNDGINQATYPAAFDLDNIISVMATDTFDNMAFFSNYNFETVDLGAPGVGILSTTPTNATAWMTANNIPINYAFESGTSASAAHVTGACVLVGVVNPALTPIQIKKIILRGVDKTLPDLCVSEGRLNLYNSVNMARKGVVLNTRTSRRYPTIQQAIDAAVNGDLLVADRNYWYIEPIDFKGKAITVRSGDVNSTRTFGTPSPQDTFISALFQGSTVVTFNKHEAASSILIGFTITDGLEGILIKDSSPKIGSCIVLMNTKSGIYCNNSSPELSDCTITENSTEEGGGGIYCNNRSNPKITNCTVTINAAVASGGGIYCENNSDPNITNSRITANQSEANGGGIYCGNNCDPNIIGCTIGSNDANWPGGGIYTINCRPLISDCTITKNSTHWDGAGIYCDTGSLPTVVNSTISGNVADYDGGGIYCNGVSIPIKNCLIIDNTVVSWDGGGIFCSDASPAITNCTFAGNSANAYDGLGGAVYCAGSSSPQITNCIFSNNNNVAIYEQTLASEPVISFCLFYKNSTSDYFDKDTGLAYSFALVNPDMVLTGSNNITSDPMFVPGRLGNYYLSQYDAGQILDVNKQFVDPNANPQAATSPAVDAGSADAISLGMHLYSTRTDNYQDAQGNYDLGRVDIGYHYNDSKAAVQFSLITDVIPQGKGNISPDPASNPHLYKQYSQVALIASPADASVYQFKSWYGTYDDNRIDRTSTGQIEAIQKNFIIMDGDKYVTVSFETILVTLRTRVVGGNGTVSPRGGTYTRNTVVNLTAIPANPAYYVKWNGSDNDFSYVRTNTVTMSEPFMIDPQGREFKEVEVIFYVTRTLNVPSDYTNIQLAINDANNRDVILIAPGTYNIYESTQDLGERLVIDGKAITITSVNPDDPSTIADTIIQGGFLILNADRDTIINGLTITASYSNGDGADGQQQGEDGTTGSPTVGGGMRLHDYAVAPRGSTTSSSSITVKNCVFLNCSVFAGNGGNGAGGADALGYGGNGGWAGWAQGGAISIGSESHPIFINCSFTGCSAQGGDGGNGGDLGHGGNWGDPEAPWWEYGPFDDYWRYTGYGGAVYCGLESTPEFVDCNFVGNYAYAGSCGISGAAAVLGWPTQHYRIDRFGGAVYCADGSMPIFAGCTFTNNQADVNGPAAHHEDTVQVVNDDPSIAYGGAIAFENSAKPTFNNCTFNSNLAHIGGAIYWQWAEPLISGCDFVANTAYDGGGVYFVGGLSTIKGSTFRENQAVLDTSIAGPNNLIVVLGEGGAINCFDADAMIVDCNIFNNEAATSGGGVYISGSNNTKLQNCLLRGNFAARDGGGISANWYSDSNIVNCTIVDNAVAGKGYGGGIYCSYNSYVKILNSIVWGNIGGTGAEGSQLALGTGFKYDQRVSTIDVNNSDIQGSMDPNAFGAKTKSVDLVFCIDTTGSMYDDIAAVKAAARQITSSIATKMPDYRISVVDYKDFNQPNIDTTITDRYGDITDYPYRTDSVFTTNTNDVIAALNSLTASGGADMPESVYTAVMHCIDHNSLAARLAGQLYGASPASLGPGAWRHGNITRVIILLGDAPPHDPEPFTNYTLNNIAQAAGGFESKNVVALLIGQDPTAATYFEGLANRTGGLVLQAATSNEVVQALMEAIDLISRIPNPVSVGNNCQLNWNPNTFTWSPNSHNIDKDPLFIAGYYLSQAAAGQLVDSPAVNTGSDLASKFGLDTYTTRIDSVPDSGIADMGYHYKPSSIPQYKLTFTATGVNVIEPDIYNPGYKGLYNWYTTVRLRIDSSSYDPNRYQISWTGTDDDSLSGPNNTVTMNRDKVVTARLVQTKYDLTIAVSGGNGRLSATWIEDSVTRTIEAPNKASVKIGTAVQLIAEPAEGYRVRKWSGTNNDASRAFTNTVTMNFDKTVHVELGPPVTLAVPRDYATIQDAIFAAEMGDTIVISPGTYLGPRIDLSKPVTIMSEHPDDPCCVAETIIDRTGYASRAFNIVPGADGTVLNGLTIQNCTWSIADANNGSRAANHPDGYDGDGAEGAAIYIDTDVTCTIKNCVIRNNQITGGNGGVGENATATANAGRGGWAGWARGGAIFCGAASNVKFINCQIIGNQANGGNGGNGGNYLAAGGAANYGGNWSQAGGIYYDPNTLATVTGTGDLWQRWGYIGNYRFYSGYGGGVFCDANSMISFDTCTINGNIALGGMSGVGGNNAINSAQPQISYEIPNFGGGVYCATGSTVIFADCNITDNISSPTANVDPNNPASGQRYRIDPYIGHGGGVGAENTASVVFTNCTFGENQASLGGGMFWANANPVLSDCNIVDNVALYGGGAYLTHGSAEIIQSDFSRNDANGPVGDGGAIYCFDVNAMIVNCTIGHNNANSNGGGIYYTGSNALSIANCLITNNLAGRNGGGVSVNWFARPVISNCTFVSNLARGTLGQAGSTGFGGGLYCGYESNCVVSDSIFWNNNALEGRQISVGTTSGFERRPSTLTISYSVVSGGKAGVSIDSGCTLRWLSGNIDSNPLFVTGLRGDYYLSQTAAEQSQNSPCVDAGSDLAGNLGMARLSTRTDEEPDKGTVDIGYHFATTIEPCSFCNFFNRTSNGLPDGIIDFKDFALFTSHWLETGCSDRNDWCHGSDLTLDSHVDRDDLEFFERCWLAQDTTAPVPNPSEWDAKPYLASPTTIRMVVKKSFDNWDWDVKYYFERLPLGETNSSWQNSREWVDRGLDLGVSYGYRVKARDELGNETNWSVIRYAGTEDTTPPAPAPYMLPIQQITPTSISMTASIAYDESGVEYFFKNVTTSGHDSGWITEPNFVDINLRPNTTYSYQVKARDLSARHNETLWSEIVYVTTLSAPDTAPPTPNPMQFADPNGTPAEVYGGGGSFDYFATMTAVVATDASGGVQYYFECIDESGLSSGWQDANTYTIAVGRSGQGLRFRVKARDIYGNETGWSPAAPTQRATTQ